VFSAFDAKLGKYSCVAIKKKYNSTLMHVWACVIQLQKKDTAIVMFRKSKVSRLHMQHNLDKAIIEIEIVLDSMNNDGKEETKEVNQGLKSQGRTSELLLLVI
jgi:hypothetical protein